MRYNLNQVKIRMEPCMQNTPIDKLISIGVFINAI